MFEITIRSFPSGFSHIRETETYTGAADYLMSTGFESSRYDPMFWQKSWRDGSTKTATIVEKQ